MTAPVLDTPADLSVEWLTAALPLPEGARVIGFTATPVGTGQMADTVRIELDYEPVNAGPATVVAKFASSDPNSRAAGRLVRCYEIEVSIYSELPALPGVPEHYFAQWDADTDSFTLLLADLAPCSQGDDIAGCDQAVAAEALKRLAKLHAFVWESEEHAARTWLNRSSPENTATLTGIITMVAPSFLERFDRHLAAEHRALVERLIPNVTTLIGWYDGPRTLVHGDYRLDNMLFPDASTTPMIVDWQTASWGSPATDVAYFIGGSLTTELRREHSVALLDVYYDALVAGGVTSYSREQLELDVRLASFGGVMMAVMAAILVVQTERGDEMFAEMFRRHAQHALDLDAEALLPDAPAEPSHIVDAVDEGRHEPDAEPLWNESWYADVVASDGSVAAYIRLGLYPNLDAAWWHVAVVGPDRPVVVCQRVDLDVPADGLTVSVEGVDIALTVDKELESFTVRGTMTGACYPVAADVYGGKPCDPVRIDIDLTWATDGVPYRYPWTTRYEIPCTVSGTVTVDDEQLRFDGPGQRDHSWGVRDWWSFGWCWSSGHFDDGTHTHLTEVRLEGGPFHAGYVQRADEVIAVASGSVSEDIAEHGFPRHATVRHDDLVVEVEPLAFGPILLTSPDGRVGRFPRASARFTTADGRHGLGWIEWNQPPSQP
ncbi:MAG TPA: phosphotransferase [Mycobacteriales bacterium]|nr:phosphotransferase [Mycobacteriales bacterium]